MTTHSSGFSRDLSKVFLTNYRDQESRAIAWADNFVETVNYSYALDSSAVEVANETIPAKPFTLKLTKNFVGHTLLPGSVSFTWSGHRYVDRLGKLYRDPSPATGLGVEVGTIDYSTGIATLDVYDGGANTLTVDSLSARIGKQLLSSATFRTPGAPLRPGSMSINGVADDGRMISATSNFDGTVEGALVRGAVDYEAGIIWLEFGEYVPNVGFENEEWYSLDSVADGIIFKPVSVFADSLAYTCVIYSYIPLDAELIGLDPVRLPSDGRVPIVKVGDVVVVHNTQTEQLPAGLVAGQEITLNRANIANVELYDTSAVPVRVTSTKYTFDADTQLLKMSTPLDLAEYTQPLVAMHRIEDMALVSGVSINGQVILAGGLQNAYPVENTFVSTAMLFGDLQARAYGLFDQKTWTSIWSDDRIGDATASNYNEIDYPALVTNAGSVRERWALVFTDASHFNIVGEVYGIVGDGYTTQDCNPINPSTGQPFFFIDYRGWGIGWATGNVLRLNTEGANHDLWIARTTLQGPATEPSDQFTIQIRGDAE